MEEGKLNVDFEENVEELNNEVEMMPDDFMGGSFIKNPEVDKEIVLKNITKIIMNKNTTGKKDERSFIIGLKDKNNKVKRIDIHCADGVFTLKNWEVYFKLFRKDTGLLMQYAKQHKNSFVGANIRIKRILDGGHILLKPADLAKILNKSLEEAIIYQETLKKAQKEQRLYEVSLA